MSPFFSFFFIFIAQDKVMHAMGYGFTQFGACVLLNLWPPPSPLAFVGEVDGLLALLSNGQNTGVLSAPFYLQIQGITLRELI